MTHDAGHADTLMAKGAAVMEVDIADVDALRVAFCRGRRACLFNAPADPKL